MIGLLVYEWFKKLVNRSHYILEGTCANFFQIQEANPFSAKQLLDTFRIPFTGPHNELAEAYDTLTSLHTR